MKNDIIKKVFVFGIIIIFFGSGLVSGYHEINEPTKFPCLACDEGKNNDYNGGYSTLATIPWESFTRKKNVNIDLIDIPDEFNWKNFEGKDWTTPAKSQGSCGSCGVFAGMGALESVINIREGNADIDPDFAEQYVLSCLPDAALVYGNGCSGGMGYMALKLMMETTPEGNYNNGALFESCFPYQASDDVPCDNKCSEWEERLVPIMDCGQLWVEEDTTENRELIKTMIMEKGPVGAYMQVPLNPNTFHNWGYRNHKPTDYFPYNAAPLNALNHEVLLLGWKDDQSIGKGGYWICKNSWGTSWGYEGFFNIEYGGCYMGWVVEWADYDPESYDWGPNIPTIDGPKLGRSMKEIQYKIKTSDPDGNDDYYLYIDWGDGELDEWIGPYKSGETAIVKHLWNDNKNYNIRLKAKDIKEKESEWKTFPIIINRNVKFSNPFYYRLFELFPNFIHIISNLINAYQ